MMVLLVALCPMSSSSVQKGRLAARLIADIDTFEMLFPQKIPSFSVVNDIQLPRGECFTPLGMSASRHHFHTDIRESDTSKAVHLQGLPH